MRANARVINFPFLPRLTVHKIYILCSWRKLEIAFYFFVQAKKEKAPWFNPRPSASNILSL